MNATDEPAPLRRWPWFVGSFVAGLVVGGVLGVAAFIALMALIS